MLESTTHIVGLGVEKCGTTSMHDYLAEHPDIATANPKETRYFTRHAGQPAEWYLGLYDLQGKRAFLDYTPAYFRSVEALERIRAFPSKKRYLFQMRHPLKRAWSFYLHDIYNHVSRGEGRYISEVTRFSFRDLAASDNRYYFQRYRRPVTWLNQFFQRDTILYLVFESMIRDPDGLRSQLAKHLDLPVAGFPRHFPRSNQLPMPRLLLVERADEWQTRFGALPLEPGLYRCELGVPLRRLELTPAEISRALELEASYDLAISAEECAELHEAFFQEDTEWVSEFLGEDLQAWHKQDALGVSFDEPLTAPEDSSDEDGALRRLIRAFANAGDEAGRDRVWTAIKAQHT